MKKVTLAVALLFAANTAFAGNVSEPRIEPPVVVEETSSSSSGDIVIPLLLLLIVAAAAN